MLAQITPVTDPLLSLVNYGILGILVVGLIMGWVWVKPAVTHAFERYEKAIEREQDTVRRLILEREELRSGIQAQLSSLQTQVEQMQEEIEETLHYVESIAIQNATQKDRH